ncbi:MAG: type II toxin-antitoxin system Phd/YefM family antitoxin [Candidatus Binataceae bacterium]
MKWQLQEAKARFSELVARTLKEGPQIVTRHGKPVAVLVPIDEYRHLKSGGKKLDFKEFLTRGPSIGALEITRSREIARDVEF